MILAGYYSGLLDVSRDEEDLDRLPKKDQAAWTAVQDLQLHGQGLEGEADETEELFAHVYTRVAYPAISPANVSREGLEEVDDITNENVSVERNKTNKTVL